MHTLHDLPPQRLSAAELALYLAVCRLLLTDTEVADAVRQMIGYPVLLPGTVCAGSA